jgi:preprotein translocase subunit SecD
MIKVSALPPAIAILVKGLAVDQLSQPLPVNDGIMMFMVCARRDTPAHGSTDRDPAAFSSPDEIARLQEKALTAINNPGFAIRVVDESVAGNALNGPSGDERASLDPKMSRYVWLKPEPRIEGSILADAHLIQDGTGKPAVAFRLTETGRMQLAGLSRANIGGRLAMVVNGNVVAAPFVKEEMTKEDGVITGNFTEAQAGALATIMTASESPN